MSYQRYDTTEERYWFYWFSMASGRPASVLLQPILPCYIEIRNVLHIWRCQPQSEDSRVRCMCSCAATSTTLSIRPARCVWTAVKYAHVPEKSSSKDLSSFTGTSFYRLTHSSFTLLFPPLPSFSLVFFLLSRPARRNMSSNYRHRSLSTHTDTNV